MWYVIRYKKNSLNDLVVELKERLGCNLKVFTPLIKIPTVNKKLKKTRQENVLGNYTLMHHEKFSSSNFVQSLKFVKGLEYFLPESKLNQKNIENFILNCKKNLDDDGFLKPSFFEFAVGKTYKFINGPFANKIFNILGIREKKLDILLGNYKVSVLKNQNFIQSV